MVGVPYSKTNPIAAAASGPASMITSLDAICLECKRSIFVNASSKVAGPVGARPCQREMGISLSSKNNLMANGA